MLANICICMSFGSCDKPHTSQTKGQTQQKNCTPSAEITAEISIEEIRNVCEIATEIRNHK